MIRGGESIDAESNFMVLKWLTSFDLVDKVLGSWVDHVSKYKFHDSSYESLQILVNDVCCLLSGFLVKKGRSCHLNSLYF